jgi:DNA-binding winged helix-turn-helix (wHTH) protein
VNRPHSYSGERRSCQYCFGEFTLDLETGVLRRGGEEVALRPKSFCTLTYLVEHHGELVPKSALINAIWPDTAVGDNSLAQCLFDIRRAIGDDSQQFIKTVARRGYIFTPPVTTPVLAFPHDRDPVSANPNKLSWRTKIIAVLAFAATATVALLLGPHPAKRELTYQQITNFTDSAVSPALSPDGRMLAFIRSDYTFGGPGQIFVKLLPDGEPMQLTNDDLNKRGSPKFSPNGALLAYAANTPGAAWDTWVVPVLGGRPSDGDRFLDGDPRRSSHSVYAAGDGHGPPFVSLARSQAGPFGRNGARLMAAVPVDSFRRQFSRHVRRPGASPVHGRCLVP